MPYEFREWVIYRGEIIIIIIFKHVFHFLYAGLYVVSRKVKGALENLCDFGDSEKDGLWKFYKILETAKEIAREHFF